MLSARVEAVLRACDAEKLCHTVEWRRRADSRTDVRLFFRDRAWLSGAEGKALLVALTATPGVAEASSKQTAVSIRFTDAAIEEAAEELAGVDLEVEQGPLSGSSYLVGFAGPNTSKALHIGHLRNIAIGNALAACLAAAGARVVRQSLVGDIGRNICEAIAGQQRFHAAEDPAALGVKWDHFIGVCYSDYVRATASGAASDDPVSRELEVAGDDADALMQRWLAGDAEVRELWRRTRDRVMDGHTQTLERMQVHIERHDTESESVGAVGPLVDRALQRGILSQRVDGTVVFESGRPEYPVMVLVRSDGFPTEHARLLAVYDRLRREQPARTYVDLAGSEWQPASAVHRQILNALYAGEPSVAFDHVFLFHGMVTATGDEKISSSQGDALLLDDILDRVTASAPVQSIAAASTGALSVEMVAAIVTKGFFLSRPITSNIEFSWDALLGDPQSSGLQFARAWASILAASADGAEERGAPSELERLVVLRAEALRRNVVQAASQLSVTALASFLTHLCENVAETAPSTWRLRRMSRSVFGMTLRSLGLA